MISEERLEEIKRTGLNLQDIAHQMGYSVATLSRILAGKQASTADFDERFELSAADAAAAKAGRLLNLHQR